MTELILTEPPELAAIDRSEFRLAMSGLAKCVAITTALGPDGPTGCTTTSMVSLSLNPPSILLSLGTGSRTLADVRSAGRFAVNLLSRRQQHLVGRFACGSPVERFRGVGYTVAGGVPLVTGATAALTCHLDRTIDVFDHTLVVGTVRALRAGTEEPLVLVAGRPQQCAETIPPAQARRQRAPHPPETP